MSNTGLTVHGITKIEIKEIDTAVTEVAGITAVWRNIVITEASGEKTVITCFESRVGRKGLPVSFVRDLDKESS